MFVFVGTSDDVVVSLTEDEIDTVAGIDTTALQAFTARSLHCLLCLKLQISAQILLTPGLYPGPGVYVGPGRHFYQIMSKLIFMADELTYDSYCIWLTLLGITASEKYLMDIGLFGESVPKQSHRST